MWLLHGTTRTRAERIVRDGPDVNFVEPGGMGITAENISFCVEGTPSDLGEAADYALRKARAFPDEGGAVVVAVDVPETIARAAMVEHLFAYGDSVLPHEADDVTRLIGRCNGVIQ